MEKQTELEKFFDGLPKNEQSMDDVFNKTGEQKPIVSEKKEEDVDPEDVEDSIKNRRHRRLEQRLQSEREANIALNERLATLSEVAKVSKESEGKIDPRLLRAFGTNDAGKEAAQIFQEMIEETRTQARKEALADLETNTVQSRQEEQAETKKYETLIENEIEAIEDTYKVILTDASGNVNEKGNEFLGLIEALSAKDEDGTITSYPDFNSAYEIFAKNQQSTQPDNNRARQVASRSMTRSGSSGTTPKKQNTEDWDGWKRDLGLY